MCNNRFSYRKWLGIVVWMAISIKWQQRICWKKENAKSSALYHNLRILGMSLALGIPPNLFSEWILRLLKIVSWCSVGEGVGFIHISLISLLLQGIPENTALVTLAFVIARIPLKWNKALLIGTVLAICAYVVRLFHLPFGVHTIVLIILLFIFLTWFGKGDYSLYLLASLLSSLALVILETCFLSLIMLVFGATPEILYTDDVIRIVITEPQVLLLFTFAFLLNKLYLRRG